MHINFSIESVLDFFQSVNKIYNLILVRGSILAFSSLLIWNFKLDD